MPRRRKGRSIYPKLNNYDFLYKKYREEKLKGREIAKIVGCSSDTVFDALKRLGIATYKRYRELEDYDFLYQKYWQEKLTMTQIAQIIGCGSTTVEGALRRLGIRTRTKSEVKKGEKHPMYGKHLSKETKQKISESAKRLWQDPNYVKKIMDSCNTKPNKVEKKVDHILQRYLSGEYAFNGDFSCGITIGGKIPDFVNVNGKKIVIEVFGRPWHDEQARHRAFGDKLSWKRTEFGTKAFYSQFGFRCVVLWEEDLKRENVEQFVLDKLKAENGIKGKLRGARQRSSNIERSL